MGHPLNLTFVFKINEKIYAELDSSVWVAAGTESLYEGTDGHTAGSDGEGER